MKYYFAYGSNLNVRAMKARCPNAKKIGALRLTQARLVFRGVADVVYDEDENSVVPGGVWRITPDDERRLDAYEGVGSKLYIKRYITIQVKGEAEKCLVYQMTTRYGVQPPSESYLGCIAQGYDDFGLDKAYLDAALRDSWELKSMTPLLRRRYETKGRERRARELEV